MKKCIDGIVYDLDKSVLVHNTYDQSLYRTNRTKRFFLLYVKSDGGVRSILPVSEGEAKDWLWNYSSNELEKLFPGWEPVEA